MASWIGIGALIIWGIIAALAVAGGANDGYQADSR